MSRALWIITVTLTVSAFGCALAVVWIPHHGEQLAGTVGILSVGAILAFIAATVRAHQEAPDPLVEELGDVLDDMALWLARGHYESPPYLPSQRRTRWDDVPEERRQLMIRKHRELLIALAS